MSTQYWGIESQVNTTTAGNQTAPQVAALRNGGFVVFWETGVPGLKVFRDSYLTRPATRWAPNLQARRSPAQMKTCTSRRPSTALGSAGRTTRMDLATPIRSTIRPTPQMVRPLVLRRPSRH